MIHLSMQRFAGFCPPSSSLRIRKMSLLEKHSTQLGFRPVCPLLTYPHHLPPPFQANPLVTPGLITLPITVICTYHILQI